MFYSKQLLDQFSEERATFSGKYHSLLLAYTGRAYKTARGKEFATHGFLRRLRTLRRCVDRVFALLPPDHEDIPAEDAREDATIAIQAFIFNVFGCMDNLAWIWVEEKAVRGPNGAPLARKQVGLGGKYALVRQSFSANFQAYLGTMADWFAHLESYRHALAHRIPLYIPPYAVAPANEQAHFALEQQINAANRADDGTLAADLRTEQRALQFFRPWIGHSFAEQSRFIVIHPQMLTDFKTVEEIALRMLEELDPAYTASVASVLDLVRQSRSAILAPERHSGRDVSEVERAPVAEASRRARDRQSAKARD
jgi:hypothetical protein